ncbi:SGNH/GDSL hydrolase family protein [Lactiplantibacillus pentosus]
MINESIQLTNLDPRIVKFQQTILNKYATANQTALKGQIVITGSSTVEIFPIEALQTKLQLKHKIYNRGIRAMTTADELAHMDTLIFELQPSILFLQIGANDMSFNLPEETMMHNYDQIMTLIATSCRIRRSILWPIIQSTPLPTLIPLMIPIRMLRNIELMR